MSEEILAEIADVLKRPEIQARFPALTDSVVDELLEAVRRFGHLHPAVGQHFNYRRDPKDEPYLNLAIEAKARFLVSRDKDILDLRDGVESSSIEFRERFPEIRIMEPLEFLQAARSELLKG